MPKIFLALTAVVALLALPQAAAAADEQQKLNASQPIAQAAFEQTDCAGRANVVLSADAQLEELRVYRQAMGFAGYAFPARWTYAPDWPFRDVPACTIYMKSGMTALGFCKTLAHEYGHLAGRQHDDEDPLMNARGDLTYEPCVTGIPSPSPFPAPARPEATQPAVGRELTLPEQVHKQVSDSLAHGYRWTVTCKQLRTAEQKHRRLWGVCTAKAAGAKPRRYVVGGTTRGTIDWYQEQLPQRVGFASS